MSEQPETCPWCERYVTRHMRAYYYGFEPTGIDVIDNILCSVASAGKAYHHTESWSEGGHTERIQKAANIAADELRRCRACIECIPITPPTEEKP